MARNFLWVFLGICVAFGSFALYLWMQKPKEQGTMQLLSSAFRNGEEMPADFVCAGSSLTPPFTIENAPAGTQSFALIATKPSLTPNPTMWIAYDIPASTRKIAEGLVPGKRGINHQNHTRIIKPCSQAANSKYMYTLYALDLTAFPDGNVNYETFLQTVSEHTLDIASISFVMNLQ